MKTLSDWLEFVITTLQTWPHCHAVRILETQQFSEWQFALKVRAMLISGGTVQVRLYRNGAHTDYAYHVIYGDRNYSGGTHFYACNDSGKRKNRRFWFR